MNAVISAAVTLAAVVAGIFGLQFDENEAIEVLSSLAIVAAWIWAMWKNHNFTPEAKAAQRVLDAMRDGLMEIEDINELVDVTEEDWAEADHD